jgi:hypothetical protein
VIFEKFVERGPGVGRVWRSPLVSTTLERREGVRMTFEVKIVEAWRRRTAERRAGQGHTRPTRAARLSAGVIKCPPFALRSSGHSVKGSADFSPQRVVGGMELERTWGVVGEAEFCGLKLRAPQSWGAAMPSVVMKRRILLVAVGGRQRDPSRA